MKAGKILDLIKDNEKQIVSLCFYMAKRLLLKEVSTNEEYIKTLIKKSLEMAQSEEEVTIRVSAKDHEWIEKNKENIFKELNLDQSTKLESDPGVHPGGIIIETNHGVIDATIEQRLEKLETVITNQS